MDAFRSDFINEVINTLSSLFNEKIVKDNLSLSYHLAESILAYDSLDEEAFAVKCRILYHLGTKGLAKNQYDTFCREYKKILGIDYTASFNDIIKLTL